MKELREALGLECTLPAIHYVLADMGLTYKKTLQASEQSRLDVLKGRAQWKRRQARIDPSRLVFLDESAAKTNMTRLRGRCPCGQRWRCGVPHEHWCTTTVIGAVLVDGSTACMAIEGATDTEVFRAYVSDVLVPTLRPGDIVVMDNLAPHKNEQTISLIEAAGARAMFLPPYSPDLNPIELMWSKLRRPCGPPKPAFTATSSPHSLQRSTLSPPPTPETGSLTVAITLFKML